ncbi:bifunctional riboflavin kinase/FAD synthetase [Paenibacillus tarimensis]
METISLSYPLTQHDIEVNGVPQTLAIGHFDGVHKGHQKVISQAVEAAKRGGTRASVMTFHPHPKIVLGQGGKYYACLTPIEDKMDKFAELGVDTAYVFRFDAEFASVTPGQFVEQVLRPLHVKKAVIGFDFRFGHRGQGTPEMLRTLGASFMEVDIADPFHLDEEKVSSTLVRARLASGNVAEAARLLGRPYRISGIVVHGDGRGRTIGFPTANISLSGSYVIPLFGVYAVVMHVDGIARPGVMNIGIKPTFQPENEQPTPEVHLFDYTGDLYGRHVQIDFCGFIRAEQKFASVQQLIDQIENDALLARRMFANPGCNEPSVYKPDL